MELARRVSAAAHSLALRAYPAWFRQRYGDAMRETFDEVARQARSLPALLAITVAECAHIATRGLAERFRRKQGIRRVRPTSPLATSTLTTHTMDTIRQDLAFAFRQILKSPGFAIPVILTLGLGIGANTAIFSVVNGVLLEPLPYGTPDRLMRGYTSYEQAGFDRFWFSWGQYNLLREQETVFDELAVYGHTNSVNVSGVDQPLQVQGTAITHTLLPTLGVSPVQGRNFTADEDQPNAEPVVLLAWGLFERMFGGDESVVGRTLEVSGTSRRVVGVLPREFVLPTEFGSPNPAELFTPMARPYSIQPSDGNQNFNLVGRLEPDATFEQGDQSIKQLMAYMREELGAPATFDGLAVSLQETVVGDLKRPLFVLLGAVGFVLLIACANVANLMLARSEARSREIAIRTALGAGGGRLLKQLLTEALVLSALGGIVAVALAQVGVNTLLAVDPTSVPRADVIGVNPLVLGFTALLSLVTGLIFGLVPALHASRLNVQGTLKEGDRGATVGGRRLTLRRTLAVSEVALSLLLAVGAGLMIKSFWQLRNVDPGLNPVSVLTFNTMLPNASYQDPLQVTTFYERLHDRLETLSDVRSVGMVSQLPIGGSNFDWSITVEGLDNPTGERSPNADYNVVSTDYLTAMGITVLRGRSFNEFDRDSTTPVVVINETMAGRWWPGEDPIGRRISLFGPPVWHEIVGVIQDVKSRGLATEPRPEMFLEHRQMRTLGANFRNFFITVRATGTPERLMDPIRRVFRELDPNLPFAQVQTVEQMIATSLSRERFSATLLSVFALVALTLASIGIYGVMSYTVAQRTHEIGVRMALGADGAAVRKLIVRQGMSVAAIGLAIGAALAVIMTRVLESLLFGVSTTDPLIFGGMITTLGAVSLASNWIPALQASRGDPLVALRQE